MSSVTTDTKCMQCGFLGADRLFDLPTDDWWESCPRCGYQESRVHKSRFSNWHSEEVVNEILYSAGAFCVVDPVIGWGPYGRVSETQVEQIAADVRAGIAAGKYSPKSYVTKYNFETREVTALVGQVPTVESTDHDSGDCTSNAPSQSE